MESKDASMLYYVLVVLICVAVATTAICGVICNKSFSEESSESYSRLDNKITLPGSISVYRQHNNSGTQYNDDLNSPWSQEQREHTRAVTR